MAGGKEWALALIDRRWKLAVVLAWIALCCIFVIGKRADILLFNLSDTDDNMRLMQVRALLHGQGWYDLRQYRFDPPVGANIHWSRLVDLPIAGLILAFGSFLDTAHAERLAVAIAPLLPLLLLLFSLALTARRLIDPRSYPLVFLGLFFSGVVTGMFLPERIDHHGWQLALLALSISAVVDSQRARGGVTLGVSSALSLAIGLEMIAYLAIAGAALVLLWVADAAEEKRLRAYAVSLAATTAIGFLLFASYDNRHPVCDALSPVWLSDAALAGLFLYGLAWRSPVQPRTRLALAVAAALALFTFHAALWPQCLHRFDAVSPEADRLWLSNVQEAYPFYRKSWRIAALLITIPVSGLIGWGILAWRRRNDREQLRLILGTAAPTLVATLLLCWQVRTAPAAHVMAIVGCAAFTWFLVPLAWRSRPRILAIPAAILVGIIGVGAVAPVVVSLMPPTPTEQDISNLKANQACTSMWAMQDVDRQPKGMVFTFLDLGPRLITLTHHDAVAGPYHRNSEQIVDATKAFLGNADQAHRLLAKYHSTYLLTCPHHWTADHLLHESPNGFYAQLDRGKVPRWLAPIQLADGSPFRMWRVVG